MNRFCAVLIAGFSLALSASGQQSPAQPPTVASSVRNFYMTRKSEVVR